MTSQMCPVGAASFQTGGQTDRCDESYVRSSQMSCECDSENLVKGFLTNQDISYEDHFNVFSY